MAVTKYTSFDRVAFAYDFLKKIIFGRSIEISQVEFLSKIPINSSVLIIGGGTGKLLKEIWLSGRAGNITYLEFSEKMLEISKRRVTSVRADGQLPENIKFIKGSIENLDPFKKFDVIFTPFVLDIIGEDQLPDFLKGVDSILSVDGLWFFTDFQISASSKWIRLYQKGLIKAMYIFFNFTSNLKIERLPDFSQYFSNLGYQVIYSASFYKDFIQSKVLQRK